MTPNILENISTWLVDWSLVTVMDNTTPPRDPNDENDEDDEDDKDDKDDEGDKDDDEDDENDDDERQDEPAVVREPDDSRRARPQHSARRGFPRLSASGWLCAKPQRANLSNISRCLGSAETRKAAAYMEDSNSEMSSQNIPLKGRTGFW
jgi:ABC-type Zn2+ transport system substrate-binding protein/surface adhesin